MKLSNGNSQVSARVLVLLHMSHILRNFDMWLWVFSYITAIRCFNELQIFVFVLTIFPDSWLRTIRSMKSAFFSQTVTILKNYQIPDYSKTIVSYINFDLLKKSLYNEQSSADSLSPELVIVSLRNFYSISFQLIISLLKWVFRFFVSFKRVNF